MMEEVVTFIDLIEALPPELASNIGDLVSILQAVGILFIIYLLFLIIRTFFDIRRAKRLGQIQEQLDRIEKRLGRMHGTVKKEQDVHHQHGKKARKKRKK